MVGNILQTKPPTKKIKTKIVVTQLKDGKEMLE